MLSEALIVRKHAKGPHLKPVPFVTLSYLCYYQVLVCAYVYAFVSPICILVFFKCLPFERYVLSLPAYRICLEFVACLYYDSILFVSLLVSRSRIIYAFATCCDIYALINVCALYSLGMHAFLWIDSHEHEEEMLESAREVLV